jgi:hypothetical protein
MVNSPDVFQCFIKASLTVLCASKGAATTISRDKLDFTLDLVVLSILQRRVLPNWAAGEWRHA